MKPRVLDYLVCPDCRGRLHLAVAEDTPFDAPQDTPSDVTPDSPLDLTQDGPEIETGELVCRECGRSYPVLRGIPRLLPRHLDAEILRTVDTFGWEWQEFDALHANLSTYRAQFLDWIHPIEPEFFKDKVVLDAGCGMGRFAAASGEFGACDVLAVDLSSAVEVAYRHTRSLPNVHVIQADIYHLPFARAFDFAFSIGVLHHLPDPEGGFRALVRHLKPQGSIFAWVYGRETNGWIIHIVNPIRERLLSRLPHKLLYVLSLLITAAAHPALKLLYRPASGSGRMRPLARLLPYFSYLSWLAQFGFRHNHHVIFDHLAAPTAFYISREEFQSWFQQAALSEPRLSWRNQNSWRGWAVLDHLDHANTGR